MIEAHHLFALDYDRIEVVVHPQSLIHAMVRLEDGSVLAHCGPPDMRVPIGYALRHPAPPPAREPMDLVGRTIEFMAPDEETFPCLALARAAGRVGGTAPAVLNAAKRWRSVRSWPARSDSWTSHAWSRRPRDVAGGTRPDTLEAVREADARPAGSSTGCGRGRVHGRCEHPVVLLI